MLKQARPDFKFPGAAFLPEDETRVRWLRPEEELQVFALLDSPFREMAKLASLTLMRLSEVRTLRLEMVHLDQGVVLLPQAKAGARPVILSAEAQKILRGPWKAPATPRWRSAGSFPRRLANRTSATTSAACGAGRPAPPGCAISTFTTCGTTGPPWP